jgi:hypothetical protein
MLKKAIIFVFLTCLTVSYAQVENDTIDSNYLEDQLYFSIGYNILRDKPSVNSKSLFSGRFTIGFIKDIPLNKQRNLGVGIGLGYVFNSYKGQLILTDEEGDAIPVIENFGIDKFNTHLVEVPLEIRWRTSTPTKYQFWRIYSGVSVAYLFSSKTKVISEGKTITNKNPSIFEKFQYGLTLSAGYSNWNLHFYYGLSPIFDTIYINEEKLNLKDFNIGLKFYIL